MNSTENEEMLSIADQIASINGSLSSVVTFSGGESETCNGSWAPNCECSRDVASEGSIALRVRASAGVGSPLKQQRSSQYESSERIR